jgi:hypothetical protein
VVVVNVEATPASRYDRSANSTAIALVCEYPVIILLCHLGLTYLDANDAIWVFWVYHPGAVRLVVVGLAQPEGIDGLVTPIL